MTVRIDLETRSACNLKACGSYVYSLHPSTSIMCVAWAYGDEDGVYLWHPGMPQRWHLDELHERIRNGMIIEAHNMSFERALITNTGFLDGWPELDPRQLRCSAAKAAAMALPRALGDGVAALGLPFPKDMAGHRLMLKLSQPRKPSLRELREVGLEKGQHELYWARHGYTWHEKPEELRRLYEYCRQDVRAERAISCATRDLSPEEQEVWFVDQEINWRGVYVDRAAAEKAVEISDQIVALANVEINELTFGAVQRCTLREPFKKWMHAEGHLIPDTKGTTIEEWLAHEDLPAHVERALRLWKSVNRTSIKKYRSMLARLPADDRVRETQLYHGASTGRFAGKGLQLQNLPRGSIKDMEAAWNDILAA